MMGTRGSAGENENGNDVDSNQIKSINWHIPFIGLRK